MSGAFRTSSGGRVDREKPLSFRFDGRSYTGLQGDTLASALLANGVHLVGRSFKYHRPRGIFAAGSEEPNAIVTVSRGGGRSTPNLRATQVELYDGLAAESQNRWPSLRCDVGAITDILSPLFSAGFYYKTFMGPGFLPSNWAWTKIYEPIIRHAAGLGRAPASPDPDRYTSRYVHCDVLVIGAGPAGLSAALAAAEAGAQVILCDEQSEMGGSLLSETDAAIGNKPAQIWAAETLAALRQHERVRLLPRTQAFGCYHDNFVALAERVTDHLANPDPESPRERLWQVFAREIVFATGAIERPVVFPGNDRPGIMLAGAGETYLTRYGVKLGRRAVLAGSHDTIYRTALALHRHGVEIARILDTRPDPGGELFARARAAALPVTTAATILRTSGRLRVSSVHIGSLAGDGSIRAAGQVACDHLLMSAGWTPSVHLFSQSRGKLAWDAGKQAFLPAKSHARERSAGACAGVDELGAVIESGFAAGESAAEAAGLVPKSRAAIQATHAPRLTGGSLGQLPQGAGSTAAKAFVDFQNDVTTKDLVLATREGFHSIEHVKRYTTTGMATDQGKTSNMNALAIVSGQLNAPLPEVGLTTFRPPYTPVTFGTFAGERRGDLFDPVRRTPIDSWAQENGAVFEDVGLWKRARYFPRAGEDMHQAVSRECATVRTSVGVFDASTLGKIEVVGPDAAEFLERMYVNAWKKLEAGRCRYGVLLNEAGYVIDDGVVGRMAADVFHVTTTTGGAPRVLHMMEDYLQTEFPDLKCWLTSTTEQWAVIAVQGPKAREVLAPLVDIDLSRDRFPHMAVRTAKIIGVPARIFRVSFTGELGFEINVPADCGRAVWDAVWPQVEKHAGCAYGTEAMHVLRAEKGFVIVGQDTDGTVTPDDLGLTWAIGKQKRDFVGKRSLSRSDMVKQDRKQLVGLKTIAPKIVLEEGSQITGERAPAAGTRALGHVTSSYWSPALNRSIALALLAGGRRRMGECLYVPTPSGAVEVEVGSPVFHDVKGERLNV